MLQPRQSAPTSTPWVFLGVGEGVQVSIDPNGNLTSDGSKTYEWDAENRLQALKQGGSTLASFSYDSAGRRSTKSAGGVTTTYVYGGDNFLEERPSAGATKRYIYGPGIDQPLAQVVSGTTSYNVADHLGSVVRTTDNAGTPTLTREYDPWGNPLQGSATGGYAFTGREWDPETGIYYYRARYYDSKVARFITEDLLPADGRSNLYGYARNNPLRLSDPSGLLPGSRFLTADDAVIDTLQYIASNPYQFKWDAWEWGGQVCQDPIDNCIFCTTPWTDHHETDVEPRRSPCPKGTKLVGWYHTHRPVSLPGFSDDDMYRSGPEQDNVPGYVLQTSDGRVRKFTWGIRSWPTIGQVTMPKLGM